LGSVVAHFVPAFAPEPVPRLGREHSVIEKYLELFVVAVFEEALNQVVVRWHC
jgi:hypothetical protein